MTPPALDLDAIEALCAAATEGPWCWARTGQKDYSVSIGANVFAEEDTECTSPLSGDVSDRLDDYRVGDGLAEMSHQRGNYDAAFIAAARTLVPQLVARVRALEARPTHYVEVSPEMLELLKAGDVGAVHFGAEVMPDGRVELTLRRAYDGPDDAACDRIIEALDEYAMDVDSADLGLPVVEHRMPQMRDVIRRAYKGE